MHGEVHPTLLARPPLHSAPDETRITFPTGWDASDLRMPLEDLLGLLLEVAQGLFLWTGCR